MRTTKTPRTRDWIAQKSKVMRSDSRALDRSLTSYTDGALLEAIINSKKNI